MGKRIRTDVAHMSLGRFTSANPDVASVARLEVTIVDERAKVGFYMFHNANKAQEEMFLQMFNRKGFVFMGYEDGPEAEKFPSEAEAEMAANSDMSEAPVAETSDVNEASAAKVIETPAPKRGRGRPRMTPEEREAAIAKAIENEEKGITPTRAPKAGKAGKAAKAAKAGKAAKAPKPEPQNGESKSAIAIKARVASKAALIAEGKSPYRPGSQRERMMALLIEGTTIANASTVLGRSTTSLASAFYDVAIETSRKLDRIKSEGQPTVYRLQNVI